MLYLNIFSILSQCFNNLLHGEYENSIEFPQTEFFLMFYVPDLKIRIGFFLGR